MKIQNVTTKWDRRLILFLAAISLFSIGFLFIEGLRQPVGATAISVQVDGREIDQFPLEEAEGKTIPYETEFGKNVVCVEDGMVFILEADCPDQLCILQGKINRPGQILVCLPNRFMVELVGKQDAASEVDVYIR